MNHLLLDSPLVIGLLFFVLATVPLLVLCCSSFVKISIVFGTMRSAFGAPGVPSATMSGVLALLLSLCAMEPVAREMYGSCETQQVALVRTPARVTRADADAAVESLRKCALPLRRFLEKHVGASELSYFQSYRALRNERSGIKADPNARQSLSSESTPSATISARAAISGLVNSPGTKASSPAAPSGKTIVRSESVGTERTSTTARGQSDAARGALQSPSSTARDEAAYIDLVPAFILSEIKRGCVAGFLLLLPFLVIDIVVANILLALGMSMVSPVTFAFPIKLGVFVFADGWLQLSQALLAPY